MTKRLAVILVVAIVAAMAGFAAFAGGGGTGTGQGADTTAAPGADDASLQLAVRVYSGSFLAGDARGVHALMSTRCQAAFPVEDLKPLVAAAAMDFGDARMTALAVTVDGTAGTATYTFTRPELDQEREPWVVEKGGWRNDSC